MQCSAFTARVLCCLCLWGCVAESIHTLPHVEQFDVVRPKRQSIRKVQSDKSPQSHEMYPDRLTYKLFFGGENHMIHLEKNRQLIGHNYTEIYYQDDGLIVSRNPNLKENCYYHGHIQDLEDSSVSVTICSGIRGFVRLKKQVYLIEPLTNHTDGDHALYKHQHLRWKRSSCGEPKPTIYDHEPPMALPLKLSRGKMESFHTPRFVELFLVVDNTEYKNYGSNMDRIRARMLEVANHVDKLYRPLNIRVMLVGLEVWTTQDQFVVSVSSDDTLSRFIKWRKSNLLKRVRHDNAQFVTGIDFLGDTVGLANKYAMCAESSAGVNQDHNNNSLGLASTIAHEMGHNMGLSHDEDHCMCGSDNLYNSICIMTERVGTQFPELFSDCSLEQLSVFLDNANPSCLLDNPSSYRLYSGPVCGNAFLDPGEQCDCGTVEECGNPCCDPTTCRLTEGSQCAQGDCCENCQIKDSENLCRAAVNECDVPEYCTGLSEKCPENDFKMNGIPCSSGKGYCYNGQCPTLLKHCQRLWGTSAKVAHEACFLRNTYGKNDSHCGKTKDGYRACTKENKMCGKIFCDGGTEYPITGQKAVIVTLWGMCNIAGDQSEEDALSMVPTGTKCEHNKVCYNYMCQDLNVYGSNENCSLKCSGRGICNHKKQCHCEPGWAPPSCDVKYSELPSIPAKIIGISVAVAIALLVLICGVVLYRKKRKRIISHKTKATSTGQHLLFENNIASNDRPQISQPIFMGTTVTQPCTPLTARVGPARPAPPPPKKPPSQLQQITVKQGIKPTAAPPVPPVKPSLATGSWMTDQDTGDTVKVVLRPPTIPRR
ncbi:disintegrin and metalloproteinase domain-containing protein 8 [Megalobrama amblycephala]|uniref:disintegrin and metalloproteinase domain-containing protein 8 n=1 Tax=Megalobrama amblycephala TaxID=75352 RepID=UPI002013D167|nr:disintegrin and metalloproteinase domain-containing protein 8 [Megalobrama amblycephala]